MSAVASKEIEQNKWNKPALLPLTSDIKLYREYLMRVENESLITIKKDPDNIEAYRTLQESILAQLILLNRPPGRRSATYSTGHILKCTI